MNPILLEGFLVVGAVLLSDLVVTALRKRARRTSSFSDSIPEENAHDRNAEPTVLSEE